MQIFISGTDTSVGKTIVSSILCIKFGFAYFKPIQTGVKAISDNTNKALLSNKNLTDTQLVSKLTKTIVYQEIYKCSRPLSPHIACKSHHNGTGIEIDKIKLPTSNKLIVEGAGGLFVPINKDYLMIDLIKKLNLPVILVSRTALGTINHTLLSIEAMRMRGLHNFSIIMNGKINKDNATAISEFGKVKILGQIDYINNINNINYEQLSLIANNTDILLDFPKS